MEIEYATDQQKAQFARLFPQFWRQRLTPIESHVVLYLAENSLARGFMTVDASLDEMVSGVPSPENIIWPWTVTPCGVSKATMYRTLNKLRDRGVVAYQAFPKKPSRYRINLDWLEPVARAA